MEDALNRAHAHATDWLASFATGPVGHTASETDLRAAFTKPLPETGANAGQVVDFIATRARPGLMGSPNPRFFAWVNGGATPAALATDWMVSAWDQNAALYAVSPVASIIEEITGGWIKDLLHLPAEASFAFTTGCQMAHMTTLAAARHAVLREAGWDVEQDGTFGAPPVTILTSSNRHGSLERAIRYLGFGRRALKSVETDTQGRMQPDALRAALAQTDGPVILALNAADLNIGAFDPFAELVPVAKAAGAWVHIDGAFGLFARASKTYRPLTDGMEQADSWVTDGHKWLNVPFDCGIAIIRDTKAHRAAMTLAADYVAPSHTARDQIDWNPEWSRRARAIPVYAALSEMGRDGVEAMIDRCCKHCRTLTEGIGALDGAEIVSPPTLNQALVRFPLPQGTDEENDAHTSATMDAINATGEAYFSGTIWKGRTAMRISVVNWQTSDADISRALAAIAEVLRKQ